MAQLQGKQPDGEWLTPRAGCPAPSQPWSQLTAVDAAELDRWEVRQEFGLRKRQTGGIFARAGPGSTRKWWKRADVQVRSVPCRDLPARLPCSRTEARSGCTYLRRLWRGA